MRSKDEVHNMLMAHKEALDDCPEGNTIIEDAIQTLLWVMGEKGKFHYSVKIPKKPSVHHG